MPTVILQFLVLAVLVAGLVGWGSWFDATRRVVNSPERLNTVIVHGPRPALAANEARAIAVAIVGEIAQHSRDIELINEASTVAETPGPATDPGRVVSAVLDPLADLVREPQPSLLRAEQPPKAIDLAFEFAGAKVDARGLGAIFAIPAKGGLDIAITYDDTAVGAARKGVASASFPGNAAYGFSLPVEGSPSQIARQIAMRYLQTQYGERAGGTFFAGLHPADFDRFWRIRVEAARIRLRGSRSGTDDGAAASLDDRSEAEAALRELKPMALRYRKWHELQVLAGNLALSAEDPAFALAAYSNARSCAPDSDRAALDEQIVRVKAALPPTTAPIGTAPPPVGAKIEDTLLAQPAVQASGLAPLRARAAAHGRPVRIALVLGEASPFPQFGTRLTNWRTPDSPPPGRMSEHYDGVAGLLTLLAPTADVVVVPVLGESGSGSIETVLGGLRRVAAVVPPFDIVFVPLGGEATAPMQKLLEDLGKRSLVVLAAGNEATEAVLPAVRAEGVVSVGSLAGNQRAAFTSFGSDVTLYALGVDVANYRSPNSIGVNSGASFAALLVAATAANLASLSAAPPTPAELEQQLLAATHPVGADRHLTVAVAPPPVPPPQPAAAGPPAPKSAVARRSRRPKGP